jgi:GrpB-like predicted nucleotidyltransferase (UPF0157 family)
VERTLLARVFADVAASIEHVGSTAVPGLSAKPVIDILIGVSALSKVESHIPELERHGFEYVRKYETRFPERRYLRKSHFGWRTHHLHAVVHGGEFWRNHLSFRNYLRDHDEAATTYLELKQRLAAQYRTESNAYSEYKSSFVKAILDKGCRQGIAA